MTVEDENKKIEDENKKIEDENKKIEDFDYKSSISMKGRLFQIVEDKKFQESISELDEGTQNCIRDLKITNPELISFLKAHEDNLSKIDYTSFYDLLDNFSKGHISMPTIYAINYFIEEGSRLKISEDQLKYIFYLHNQDFDDDSIVTTLKDMDDTAKETFLKDIATTKKEQYDKKRNFIQKNTDHIINEYHLKYQIDDDIKNKIPLLLLDEINSKEDLSLFQAYLRSIFSDKNKINKYKESTNKNTFRYTVCTIKGFRKFQKDQKESEKQ